MSPPLSRVAVTGATGFIGRRLCAGLSAAGHPVRGLARKPQRSTASLEWTVGHLADLASLERLVADCAVVVHCAGAVRGASSADFRGPNVDGVANLLAAIEAVNPSVRLLHVSTLAAREPQLSEYAASKRAGEALALTSRVRTTVIRPPAVYGPGDRELMPLLLGLYRGIGIVPGHGGRFALICVDDLVDAMLAWMGCADADGECYEVHDGAVDGGYDWNQVIEAVEAVRGRPVIAIRVPRSVLSAVAHASLGVHRLARRAPMLTPGKVRELYFPDWTCSNDRFNARTGWRPRIDLQAGLRLTLADAGVLRSQS